MQAFCQSSDSANGKDTICCTVCGQAFDIFWERTSQTERDARLAAVIEAIAAHHATSSEEKVHPSAGFNVPQWSGVARFSGAALLGGAPGWKF